MTWANLNALVALPEIFLLCAVSLILLIDLWLKDSQRNVSYGLTLVSILISGGLASQAFFMPIQYAFTQMFVSDALASGLKVGIALTVLLQLIYGRSYMIARGLFRGEFFTLTLFALLGMMVMVSANHLLTLYMGLELLSLSLYALIALHRDSLPATEAAMKYFVLGALASGLLLYGMSMLYGATGSLSIKEIAQAFLLQKANVLLMILGLVFVVTGLGFKLGVVPFHMWMPDVYQGSPTVITQLIGSATKLAAFAIMIRLLVQGLPNLMVDWQGMLLILSMLSLIIGNVAAIAQTNIKRMFAYSTIAQMGFVLMGVLTGTSAGYAAAMYYVTTYVFTASAGFGMIMLLAREGFEAENIEDFRGLAKSHPWYALMMSFVMFSMAGIPVFVGFFAKLAVLKVVVNLGLIWLAVVAVMCSLIGAFYYLRVVKVMFFEEATQVMQPLAMDRPATMILSVNAGLLLILGLLPDSLMVYMQQAITLSLIA